MIYKVIDYTDDVTRSDDFLDMQSVSQALYFHLNRWADSDGFVNNAKAITRMCNCTDQDLQLLVENEFIMAIKEEG